MGGRVWNIGINVRSVISNISLGIKRYKKQGPIGSPFTKVVQVFVAAARKWRVYDTHGVLGVCFGEKLNDVQVEAQPTVAQNLAHTKQFRYMSKFKISAKFHR